MTSYPSYEVSKSMPEHILHECIDCHKSFVSYSNLKEHMQSHFSKSKNKCYQCSKEFTSLFFLQNHMTKHTDEKKKTNPQLTKSGKYTGRKSNMQYNKNNPSYKCQMCEKSFTSISGIDKHMSSHTGEKKKVYKHETFNPFKNPEQRSMSTFQCIIR